MLILAFSVVTDSFDPAFMEEEEGTNLFWILSYLRPPPNGSENRINVSKCKTAT